MKLEKAQLIASIWMERLRPHCERIEIAGSIRRMKPEVKDIELICIPKETPVGGLFGDIGTQRSEEFQNVLRSLELEWISGQITTGKYIKLRVREHDIIIDLFTATKDNWGFQFAIRTGSADYSHRVLANAWSRKGYHGGEGYLRNEDELIIPVREESDLFNLIGVPYTEPQNRVWP